MLARNLDDIRRAIDDSVVELTASTMQQQIALVSDIVNKVIPQIVRLDSEENKMRRAALEICTRLATRDTVIPHALSLSHLAVKVLAEDNVENCLIALKVIVELFKCHRGHLDSFVQLFVDFMLQYCVAAVARNRNDKSSASAACDERVEEIPQSKRSLTGKSTPIEASPSTIGSFRIVAEFPKIFISLLQYYPVVGGRSGNAAIQIFVQICHVSIPSSHTDFRDCIRAQVECLRCSLYILGGYPSLVVSYDDAIAQSICSLLRQCPADIIGARHDLLQLTKQFLGIDSGAALLRNLKIIVDERLIVGPNIANYLRPLAVGTLTDLIERGKQCLDLHHLAIIVNCYCTYANDSLLPFKENFTSIKLLTSVVELIRSRGVPEV
jgi:transformation/transcription domain-associated protein